MRDEPPRSVLAALSLAAQPAAATAAGGTVAFTSHRDGVAHVYAVDADGSGLRPLTRTRGAAFEGSPAFSPDGGRIAYTCGNFELCVMDADGTASGRLTANDWPRTFRYDTSPAWSPDGTTIAFVRTVGGRDGIWLVNADGSGMRPLPVPAGVNNNPSFSPGGRTIAFDHAEDETGDSDLPTSSDTGVYVIGADGSALRRVTPRSANAASPAWSPDGARIVFAAGDAHGSSLWHVAATGGALTRLTRGRAVDLDPAWQLAAAVVIAAPVVPPAAAPSRATADARTVALVLRAGNELGALLGVFDSRRAGALLAAAQRVDAYARRIASSARALRPATRRGRRVRSHLLRDVMVMRGLAAETRKLSRSVRRHDRGGARRQRNNIGGGVFALALLMGSTIGETGVSQAGL
ncbi:MAG: TolB protein [Solirubrobacteraceae bacterium]|nr:TolB protein [Solirubrobacteraceae bacterium]